MRRSFEATEHPFYSGEFRLKGERTTCILVYNPKNLKDDSSREKYI